jgi:hypothetical protein
MKKTQKRLGNKGFSLVELIVVIAIMAVLVGVLAPTLIKNVEKSKVSKDEQNLDSVKEAITTVLSDQDYYDTLYNNSVTVNGKTGSLSISSDLSGTNTALSEIKDSLGSTEVKMSSKKYNNSNVTFTITNGKVSQGDPAEIK